MRAGDDDPNVRVIVLTGVGRGFCSGANLGSRATQDITGENFPGNRGPHEGPDAARQHFFHGFTDLHRDISLIRKPTIAMINGPAVGSGMDMALHCDIRIGCERTRFIGYHNAGQIIENGGSYYLAEDGRPRARAGIRLYRRAERGAGLSVGHAEPSGAVGEAGGDHARVVRADDGQCRRWCNGSASASCAPLWTARWRRRW